MCESLSDINGILCICCIMIFDRWMSKQPTTLSSANSSSKGDAGAVAGFVKGDKANRRFLSLRDNTLRYDNVQTLSSRSHCEACESDSVLHTRSPSSSPRPSLSPVPSPIPSGMLKVVGDKTSPKVSHRKGDLSTPSSLASPLPSSLKTSAVTAATIRTSPAASAFAVPPATPVNGTRRTLASHIYSMFSKKSIKSPAKPRVNRLWAFGGRRKDRYNRDASGVIDITESSTVTTRCSNPRPGVCPFITLETAKETLRVCYEHMDPPPALPFGHQGYDELHSSVTRRRSVSSGSSSSSSKNIGVDSKRDTVHAHWINEMRRSIAQQTKSKSTKNLRFFILFSYILPFIFLPDNPLLFSPLLSYNISCII